MEFLSNIGKEGWPKEVWYRYDDTLLRYSLVNGMPHVQIEEADTLLDVRKKTKKFKKKPVSEQPVLLLEMAEHEKHPSSSIATLVHLSNRNVYSITKGFDKASATYMLVDPPTSEDLCNMASFEAQFGSNSVFQGMAKEDIIKTVSERVEIIGPVPRSVFVTDEGFRTKVIALKNRVNYLFDVVEKMSEADIPSNAKNYIAPFVDDETVVPYLTNGMQVPFSLRFLSDYIKYLVTKACNFENKRDILGTNGYAHQLQEAIVRYGLLLRDGEKSDKSLLKHITNDDWNVQNWIFYKNSNSIEDKHRIKYSKTGFSCCA
jgi:hypothetical protein